MPFACIYVPNFPVAAAFRAEPELRARAVAIFEGKPPLEKVFAVNESAGRMGIAPGMTKAQAELCSEKPGSCSIRESGPPFEQPRAQPIKGLANAEDLIATARRVTGHGSRRGFLLAFLPWS